MTRLALFVLLVTLAAAQPVLIPPARHVEWTGGSLPVASLTAIAAETAAERQVARILSTEMRRLHRRELRIAPAGALRLALEGTARGEALLRATPSAALYRSHAGAETYLLETSPEGAAIVARTPAGLLYGVQTLVQMVGADGKVAGARIVDYPQLAFRGLHICVFPHTELAAVRQAILMAARFKYNAVVIEPWASLRSPSHPETAYEHTYTPAQFKSLVDLGRSLHMEMIPMLNSWGHASGMPGRSAQHVVLDRFPQFKRLYEEDGWSFCLTNPDIYRQLLDRYAELLELFGNPRYFHLGMDEAWGHRGLMASDQCRGENPRAVLAAHIRKLHAYFAARKVRIFLWHDMFIQRDHPRLGRLSPANSRPPFDSHLVLDELPKDIVMDCWNYDSRTEWPVTQYFHERGFPVVVSPWKTRKNAVQMVETAKKLNVMGLLETTWDSLDSTLPTVGEAGVAAWSAPGFDLDTIPYESFVRALRALPICDLPRHEDPAR